MTKPTVEELRKLCGIALASLPGKTTNHVEKILATALLERLEHNCEERSFINSRITYRGFGYGMGSQWGIDSLQQAINKRGDN
jgi:hypothetical protein